MSTHFPVRRTLAFIAVLLGSLGVVASVTGIWLGWAVGVRAQQANEYVFDEVGRAIDGITARVVGARQHLQEAKITSRDVADRVRDWTRHETGGRLVSELQLEERAERLTRGLQQAELLLDVSVDSIESLKRAVGVGTAVGLPVDGDFLQAPQENLKAMRKDIRQISATLQSLQARAAELTDGEGREERIVRLGELLKPAVATLTNIDQRMEDTALALSGLSETTQMLAHRTRNWINVMRLTIIGLIAWMGLGQLSLIIVGRQRLCRGTS